jgi:nitrite reductase/ring-hydroxylating ferredoxin subunit
MTSADSRYPFAIPSGWFAVAESPDIEIGQTKAAYYFATHLVVWRDETGEAHVQDAFCPHLGAHLGHGGLVDGCDVVCPFHGWKFDGEGCNTEIPYSDRTNKKAKIHPGRERSSTFRWLFTTWPTCPRSSGLRARRAAPGYMESIQKFPSPAAL